MHEALLWSLKSPKHKRRGVGHDVDFETIGIRGMSICMSGGMMALQSGMQMPSMAGKERVVWGSVIHLREGARVRVRG